ncbi:hypothetical protein DIPPA_19963 [Diplonema papillatum]|nr:hypothetical protein DIPPA_19963 [Diplonema papillatum]
MRDTFVLVVFLSMAALVVACPFEDLVLPAGMVAWQGNGSCTAGWDAAPEDVCTFLNASCNAVECLPMTNGLGWNDTAPCRLPYDDDDDEVAYGGVAVILVVTPMLSVVFAFLFIRVRERQLANAAAV